MTLPSRIAAVVLLLASLGLVFVLVSNAGVSTDVYLANPTLTPLPTANAANWAEIMAGQLVYKSDPNAPFQVSYNSTSIDAFITGNSLQPLAEDTETPMLDLLTSFAAGWNSSWHPYNSPPQPMPSPDQSPKNWAVCRSVICG